MKGQASATRRRLIRQMSHIKNQPFCFDTLYFCMQITGMVHILHQGWGRKRSPLPKLLSAVVVAATANLLLL